MFDLHDHNHEQCRAAALERAERLCREQGLRLTAQRRMVLDVMLENHAPVTAYEIMDRIGEISHRPSPISVYRALDFLVASGLVHRIESRNAFLACSSEHRAAGSGEKAPTLLFMLCEACGAASEAESTDLTDLIGTLAGRSGFGVASSIIEVKGLCAACRQARLEAAASPSEHQEQS